MISRLRAVLGPRKLSHPNWAIVSQISRSLATNVESGSIKSQEATLFYKHSNAQIIRAMLLGTGVNTLYWGCNTIITLSKNTVSGDPFGMDTFDGAEVDSFLFVFSGILLYLTSMYGKYSVYKCFETPDGKRLGLQVHTAFGNPGRIYEVPIGNAWIVPGKASGTVSLRVLGFGKNFVFTNEDEFNKSSRLQELLSKDRDGVLKEERTAWRGKAMSSKKGQNRKN